MNMPFYNIDVKLSFLKKLYKTRFFFENIIYTTTPLKKMKQARPKGQIR